MRAKIKYQGYVCRPYMKLAGSPPKTQLTFLANMDVGGAVPSMFVKQSMLRFMVLPKADAKEAEEAEEVEEHF